MKTKCPNCGYCPECGRSDPYRTLPYSPQWPYGPIWVAPTWSGGGTWVDNTGIPATHTTSNVTIS